MALPCHSEHLFPMPLCLSCVAYMSGCQASSKTSVMRVVLMTHFLQIQMAAGGTTMVTTTPTLEAMTVATTEVATTTVRASWQAVKRHSIVPTAWQSVIEFQRGRTPCLEGSGTVACVLNTWVFHMSGERAHPIGQGMKEGLPKVCCCGAIGLRL